MKASLVPVIAPRHDGGVHLEWNLRGRTLRHLEIAVPPDTREDLSFLQTIENDGEIISSTENAAATVADVVLEFEKLLNHATRKGGQVI